MALSCLYKHRAVLGNFKGLAEKWIALSEADKMPYMADSERFEREVAAQKAKSYRATKNAKLAAEEDEVSTLRVAVRLIQWMCRLVRM
jgi:hypothetical protein